MKSKLNTNLRRIIVSGYKGFKRNTTVSASSIFILVITLSIITSLFFWNGIFDYSINKLKNKVDIAIYFKPNTTDDIVLNIKSEISEFPEIKETVFNSAESRFNKFKQEKINDTDVQNTLETIGVNPLGPSLVIRAKDSKDYSVIYDKLQEKIDMENNNIDKISYLDVKDSIDNLNHIVTWLSNIGLIIVVIFIIMSVMINYNTIRISIFVFKNEISVMKLVGASNWFIRGPFVVQGFISGFIASIISIMLAYPISYWLDKKALSFLGGFDVVAYYHNNFFTLFGILLVLSISMSGISAYTAARRYLKI